MDLATAAIDRLSARDLAVVVKMPYQGELYRPLLIRRVLQVLPTVLTEEPPDRATLATLYQYYDRFTVSYIKKLVALPHFDAFLELYVTTPRNKKDLFDIFEATDRDLNNPVNRILLRAGLDLSHHSDIYVDAFLKRRFDLVEQYIPLVQITYFDIIELVNRLPRAKRMDSSLFESPEDFEEFNRLIQTIKQPIARQVIKKHLQKLASSPGSLQQLYYVLWRGVGGG